MSIEIKMPRLSDTMEQGTLVKWYVKEGDKVEADQVLADIETDKATMEMPSYDDGVVAKVVISEGDTVAIGELMLVLAEEGEDPNEVAEQAGPAPKGEGAESSKSKKKSGKSSDDAEDTDDTDSDSTTGTAVAERPSGTPKTKSNGASGSSREPNGRLLVSPLARRLAEDHDLDLKSIDGSGPGGRIVKRDVMAVIDGGDGVRETAASAPAPAASAPDAGGTPLGGSVKLSNMRQTIAKRLVESKQSIPHYQVSVVVNMDPLLDLRKTLNAQLESQGVKLSVNDFVVRAAALSIHHHPMFNAAWKKDSLEINDRVNVGMAVSLPEERGGGLLVATIFDADRKGLRQISTDAKTLANKARTKGLSPEEMSGSTFTISNLGMYEVDFFTAIINPPNAAILAVGSALERPVVRDGEIVVGHEMNCTLSLDHRIIDGAMAAQFLQTFRQMLENPATLLV
ncbi:MAG: dihydrolipoamide acetyltransferase family protein [Phycisphaerales bacterium]